MILAMNQIIIFILISLSLSQAASFGIIGDGGDWNKLAQKTRDSMLRLKVTDLILPGDNIYDESLTYDSIWKNWITRGFNFSVVAIGNHNRSYAEEMAYFKMEGEYHTKVIGGARFIVLNSDNNKSYKQQADFLASTLREAKEKFIFVVYHHPPFSLLHKWEEKPAFQKATRPILLANAEKITALLLGHDHIASYNEMNGLPAVLSGAVMSTYDVAKADYVEEGRTIKTRWSSVKGQIYWGRLDVDEESGEAWVHYVRSMNDEVNCSIRLWPRPVTLKSNCGDGK